MSGHSKWSKIKRQKGAADKKKGQVFSKFAKSIAIAAGEGGGDPEMNAALRLEVSRAKSAGMPSASIERAIKKGTGEDKDGEAIEQVVYEGYGPGGVAVLVVAATDNRNRTSSGLKHIFSKNNGNLATSGSVNYLFETRGQILVAKDSNKNLDEVQLIAIDAGASDVNESEEGLEIYTAPEQLETVVKKLEEAGVKIEAFEKTMHPQNQVQPDESEQKNLEKLLEMLEDDEDVIAVHSNLAD